ncbi:ATP-dependent RNA helicase [Nematocida parisii]|nr:ATP-dependent RNA helicase [Nematocida parisii]KAI5130503.1 ATP-dependent RNA helicase [Nematocida parisii]KAI5143898.1 ATP-dependent RNA helicase [Nematocida parisii]KAI5145861.1 ATP-dependent RNA helicase [Nematocida parisii]KAI5158459.1 ATP-dependent RNA helicase [Nematocida parisii]
MEIRTSEFEQLGLSENILMGIFAYGFSTPSKIQKDAIGVISGGKSVLMQSKNGTGKTATFLLGMLQKLTIHKNTPYIQSIVLSPTRDLAIQTFNVFNGLAKYMGIKGYCAVGQTKKVSEDVHALNGCTVLFGTPGRVLHLLKESIKTFNKVHMVVLDEADRVVESGFSLPVRGIFERIKPMNAQFVFVSATLPQAVTEFLTEYLPEDYESFLVPQEELALSRISQFYINVVEKKKFNRLCDIFSTVSISQAVIFANRKETVMELGKKLQMHEFPAVIVHGGIEQAERNKRMSEFFSGKHRILVCTDVCARGIDAVHVNLVVNYDAPLSPEEYLHRIGRGGRFGKTSIAISLLEPSECSKSQAIFSAFGKALKEFVIPEPS